MKNECVFGKDNPKMTSRGWVKETVSNNDKIEFRYGNNRCPYTVQQKCKFFEPIDTKRVEIKDSITVKNLEDLDVLTDEIRERLKCGALKVGLE